MKRVIIESMLLEAKTSKNDFMAECWILTAKTLVVFEKLLPAMQQTLLLEMAEKQKDKMEQCRYLLLLFKLFPESAGQFGLQLIDLLGDFSAEKNVYTQILVDEIIPTLFKCKDLSIPETKCCLLFKQSLNFHLNNLKPNIRSPTTLKSSKMILQLETLEQILREISTDRETTNEKMSISNLIFVYLAYQKYVIDDFK
uniref:Uncharacterized protein n=1 Tax=Romanomermis culicivorax TaxID=13658 RepID=A0A915JQ17_ROMCU